MSKASEFIHLYNTTPQIAIEALLKPQRYSDFFANIDELLEFANLPIVYSCDNFLNLLDNLGKEIATLLMQHPTNRTTLENTQLFKNIDNYKLENFDYYLAKYEDSISWVIKIAPKKAALLFHNIHNFSDFASHSKHDDLVKLLINEASVEILKLMTSYLQLAEIPLLVITRILDNPSGQQAIAAYITNAEQIEALHKKSFSNTLCIVSKLDETLAPLFTTRKQLECLAQINMHLAEKIAQKLKLPDEPEESNEEPLELAPKPIFYSPMRQKRYTPPPYQPTLFKSPRTCASNALDYMANSSMVVGFVIAVAGAGFGLTYLGIGVALVVLGLVVKYFVDKNSPQQEPGTPAHILS